ncbi:copper homeostasis membrane protein CopD [Pseudomonas sp. TE3610]
MSALVVVRFLHFCVVLLVFGSLVFRPLLLGDARQQARMRLWLDPFLCLLAGIGLITAIAWLMVTAADMTGNWQAALNGDTVMKVLTQTFFGKAWFVHLFASLILLLCLRIPARLPNRLLLGISTVQLATLAPVGHAAMLSGIPGLLLMLNQLIHLLCVAGWMGALLLLMFIQARPNGHDVRGTLTRFSRYGLVLVAGIIVTGLINVRVLTGSLWPTPMTSGFALVLAVKASLVACMLALALFNRAALANQRIALDKLRQTVLLEWLCGMAAIAAVSLLGTLSPVPLV